MLTLEFMVALLNVIISVKYVPIASRKAVRLLRGNIRGDRRRIV